MRTIEIPEEMRKLARHWLKVAATEEHQADKGSRHIAHAVQLRECTAQLLYSLGLDYAQAREWECNNQQAPYGA
jgi:hypothetical protein